MNYICESGNIASLIARLKCEANIIGVVCRLSELSSPPLKTSHFPIETLKRHVNQSLLELCLFIICLQKCYAIIVNMNMSVLSEVLFSLAS